MLLLVFVGAGHLFRRPLEMKTGGGGGQTFVRQADPLFILIYVPGISFARLDIPR